MSASKDSELIFCPLLEKYCILANSSACLEGNCKPLQDLKEGVEWENEITVFVQKHYQNLNKLGSDKLTDD